MRTLPLQHRILVSEHHTHKVIKIDDQSYIRVEPPDLWYHSKALAFVQGTDRRPNNAQSRMLIVEASFQGPRHEIRQIVTWCVTGGAPLSYPRALARQ